MNDSTLFLLCSAPHNRKEICVLKALCKQKLSCDSFNGTIFVFANRARTSVKLLVYDSSGFWLAHKRFSQERLAWWPNDKSQTITLRASELQILLAQRHPMKAAIPKDWRCVTNYATNNNVAIES